MSAPLFFGPVPYDRDFPLLGEYTPAGTPNRVEISIDTFIDVKGFVETDTQSFIPISNVANPYDALTHSWVSNGAAMTVGQAFGPVYRVRKLKLSGTIEITYNSFPGPSSRHYILSFTKILDTAMSDEEDIEDFRGFAFTEVKLYYGDLDSVFVEYGGFGEGEDEAQTQDYSGVVTPILEFDIGHIRSGAMENESNAQIHSYLRALVDNSTIGFANGDFMFPFAAPYADTGGTFALSFSGFHSYSCPLLRPVDAAGSFAVTYEAFTISGAVTLEPAAGEANAFWAYDNGVDGPVYDTTTGAAL